MGKMRSHINTFTKSVKSVKSAESVVYDEKTAIILHLIMQNKANFREGRMSVTTYSKKGYENLGVWSLGKNKANQSQFQDGLSGQSRLRRRGNTHHAIRAAIALPRSGLCKLPSDKALEPGRPPGRSLAEVFFAGKPWPAGRAHPSGSDGR